MISKTQVSVLAFSAELTRVTRIFKFMSPRVVVNLGDQQKMTEKHKRAGKYPEWHQVIELETKGGEQFIELAVYDSKIKNSRLVGKARIDLQYAKGVGFIDEWIVLQHKGKAVGKIWIIMRVGSPPQEILNLPYESVNLESAPLYPSIPGLQVKLFDSKVVGLSYKAPAQKDDVQIIAQPKYEPPPFYQS